MAILWRSMTDAFGEARRTLFGYDIFISYASDDQKFASALHDALKERYAVFFDKKSGVTATPLASLLQASGRSRMVLVVLTSATAGSSWVADEVDAHLHSRGVARVAAIFASSELIRDPPPRLAVLNRYGGIRIAPDDLRDGVVPPQTVSAVGSTFGKIRRARVLRSVAALLILLVSLAFGLFVYITPAWSWTKTDVTELDTIDAIPDPDDRTGADVWALTGGYHVRSLDDDSGGVTYQSVLDLNHSGGIAGCMGFNRSEGGIAPFKDACAQFGPLGVFAQRWDTLNAKWHQVFAAFAPWIELAGPSSSYVVSQSEQEHLVTTARTMLTASRASEGDNTDAGPSSQRLLRVFNIGAHGRLAFVMFTSASQSRVVPLRAKDASNWAAGHPTAIDVSDTPDIAIGSQDAEVLYVATRDHRVAGESDGLPGGVFRSIDGGLTWRALSFPPPFDTWQSFSSVKAAPGAPGHIAVAIDPTKMGAGVRPNGAPGVITTCDAGQHWTLLATGFQIPEGTHVELVGVASTGQVSALLRQRSGQFNPGRLIFWRRLSLLERLRGKFGLS